MVRNSKEARKHAGRPRNAEPKKLVTVRLPESLVEKVDAMASGDVRSRASLCEILIREGVDQRTAKAEASSAVLHTS